MVIKDNINIPLKQQVSTNVNAVTSNNVLEKAIKDVPELKPIIQNNSNLFLEPNEKLTYTTRVKAEINTNTDSPIYCKSYPYPVALKDEIEKQIKQLLNDEIIRPSRSPYNAPVWIVPKKMDNSGEKKFRMVIDYRKLNAVTIPDRYPIPDIQEIISNIGENAYFSLLDLKSGFHQIPLKNSDIEKTSFSINGGKYEFLRLPFGLKNAPSIFQRTLDDILREHIGKQCYVYIDDIIILGKSKEEHLKNINSVFHTLSKANMKVQLDKCEFFKKEVEFLGFIISSEGIKTNPKKVEAIKQMPEPKTLKELRSFLGLTGHYRKFILDYAKLAKPLTALLRGEGGRVSKNQSKNVKILVDELEKDAFQKLKNTLVSQDVILNYPDFKKAFELTTDASKFAIGAVLSQEDKPIAFLSRTLNKTEEDYGTNEKEMLAIIWALNSLRNYLYGSRKVKIFTDHQPLTYALSNKNNNSKMKRWKAILEEYNYELYYKPGKANVVADALSRTFNSKLNSMSLVTHSHESSGEGLIPFVEAPLTFQKSNHFLY